MQPNLRDHIAKRREALKNHIAVAKQAQVKKRATVAKQGEVKKRRTPPKEVTATAVTMKYNKR